MTIGEKISTRRKELGLTLEDVGKAVGVGKSTVKKWESGFIANMRRDKIATLAKALQMNPTEFINGDLPLTNASAPFTSEEVRLIDIYRNLNPVGQAQMREQVDNLSKIDKYKKGTISDEQDVG